MESAPAKFGKRPSASREDWLLATLDVLRERGIEGVKVVAIARRLGLTTGSFYWHFKNIQDLLDGVLEYWEEIQTGHIIQEAMQFKGAPEDRIRNLMHRVIAEDASMPDSAVAVWAKSDAGAAVCYTRAMEKRFDFSAWLFEEAGFDKMDAKIRGRMMVMTLMGETAAGLREQENWEQILDGHWKVLIKRKPEI
ncbi:MAG: TetR/AcrR family transcriptional regulator [Paracoccaceae bacterium]